LRQFLRRFRSPAQGRSEGNVDRAGPGGGFRRRFWSALDLSDPFSPGKLDAEVRYWRLRHFFQGDAC